MSFFISDDRTSTLTESFEQCAGEHCSQPSSDSQSSKKADLAGPGIGDYDELKKILPHDYNPLLTPKETQQAIFHLKRYIEDNLCKELSLMMVEVPLIVDAESGVNDMLDRDGSRTPIQFHISNDRDKHPIDAQVVQAATKWKSVALKQFECRPGEGICTDMRAVRKDYFLDHDHSAYVDQWDWERAITAEQRNLEFLKSIVRKIWKVLVGAEKFAQEMFPDLRQPRYPNLPEELTFLHAEELLAMYPDLPRKRRETVDPAKVSGHLHHRHRLAAERRLSRTRIAPPTTTTGSPTPARKPSATPTDSTATSWSGTTSPSAATNSVRWASASTPKPCASQLEMSNLLDNLKFPYHQGIINNELPLSIGGGIGQSRTLMLLLRKAHLGEVSVTVWPKVLKEMCAKKNIFVLE